MTKNELEAYFLSHNYPRYEREGWDNYCEAVGLKLTVPCIHAEMAVEVFLLN